MTLFVDLTQQGELEPYAAHRRAADALRRRGRSSTSRCRRASALVAILDEIDAELEAGGVVYVHCWAGCGRTGVVVGSWLVRHGADPGDALQRIADARGRRMPADARATPLRARLDARPVAHRTVPGNPRRFAQILPGWFVSRTRRSATSLKRVSERALSRSDTPEDACRLAVPVCARVEGTRDESCCPLRTTPSRRTRFAARLDVLMERMDTLASTVATTASAIAKKDGEIAALRARSRGTRPDPAGPRPTGEQCGRIGRGCRRPGRRHGAPVAQECRRGAHEGAGGGWNAAQVEDLASRLRALSVRVEEVAAITKERADDEAPRRSTSSRRRQSALDASGRRAQPCARTSARPVRDTAQGRPSRDGTRRALADRVGDLERSATPRTSSSIAASGPKTTHSRSFRAASMCLPRNSTASRPRMPARRSGSITAS